MALLKLIRPPIQTTNPMGYHFYAELLGGNRHLIGSMFLPSMKVILLEKEIDFFQKWPICEGFRAILWTDRNSGFPPRDSG